MPWATLVKLTIPVNSTATSTSCSSSTTRARWARSRPAWRATSPAFINLLSTIEGGLPDVHIGVVSSNVGTWRRQHRRLQQRDRARGRRRQPADQYGSAGVTAGYLEDIRQPDGSRARQRKQGTSWPTSSRAWRSSAPPAAASRRTSSRRTARSKPGKNPGFLRPDAYLAIVFVADEDDCSALPGGALFGDPMATIASPLGPRTSFRCWEFGVECDSEPNPRAFGTYRDCRPRAASPYMQGVQRYVDYVRSLKDSPRDIVVAGIIGNVDDERTSVVIADPDDVTRPMLAPACTSAVGVAAPAHRIQAFLDSFGDHATTTTICNENLDDALVQIGEPLEDHAGRAVLRRAPRRSQTRRCPASRSSARSPTCSTPTPPTASRPRSPPATPPAAPSPAGASPPTPPPARPPSTTA